METADVVVVGLGAVGSATLLRLARGGLRAVGIDRFDPPHPHGSTHGGTRVTRLATAEGDAYVPLVRRSHEIWRELEEETGETLLRSIGLIMMGEGDGGLSHGRPGFLGATVQMARRHRIPHELLDSAEIRRRYPQFQVRDGDRAFFEPSGGVVFPERAVAVQLRLARQRGAVVRPNETVLAIEPNGDGVVVVTDKGRIAAARVVLAAGAWLPGLAANLLPDVLRVHRQTLLWYEADDPSLYDPANCPVFIWMHGAAETDYLYGFPLMPGEPGVKVGSERYEGDTDPDRVDGISDAEAASLYDRHVAGRLGGLSQRLTHRATCLYTVTADADFIIDRLGEDGRVLAASCCSGHGFKHSAALGEEVAQAILAPDRALKAEFALARFAAAVQ
ncbi:MAG: N-methyl-L-tryptophan oxidase [Acetobacteraceae bacterium]|nr:N-methyl-L-tryptophan oxidase [Acetobacteraceae bacterium]